MKKIFTVIVAIGLVSSMTVLFAYKYNLYVWQQPQQSMWIFNGHLFDGVSAQAFENKGILVVGGKISCMGEACNVPEDTIRINATDKTIVPGLIELHGHFFGGKAEPGKQSVPSMIWDSLRFNPNVRRKLISAGITSYRSVGDPASAILELKNQLNSQKIAGPRMFIAGPIFTARGGHPTRRIPGWMVEQMVVQSDDPEFVKQKVSDLAKQGVDGVKVVYQGTTNTQGVTTMPRIAQETLFTITAEARKHGLWVAVHAGSPEEHVDAVEAGITTIEHGIRHGHLIQPETLKLILENNIIYVPTLAREPKGHLNIPALYQAGVKFGVGTDTQAEMIVGDSYHAELSRMVDAGLPDSEALLAATRNGAIALGKLDEIGTIEVGKHADLLIVDGQPWIDIRDLRKIDLVIMAGRIAL